eukprot:15444814-Alexandrium_andersonii.AAC.1
MTGPDTRFPLAFASQKQKSVSHSTPEAEIVAMDHVLRTMLPPSLALWETLLERKVDAFVRGDNQACFQIAKSGSNPAVRHLERTHRCDVQWVHERYLD